MQLHVATSAFIVAPGIVAPGTAFDIDCWQLERKLPVFHSASMKLLVSLVTDSVYTCGAQKIYKTQLRKDKFHQRDMKFDRFLFGQKSAEIWIPVAAAQLSL